ncbi:MAG TPA: T9SS type A sorting domain-containing protein, partial [Cytophaga sp.]|nr:T9SS type A sorting domain-containing protein [Cytophaga sp.]
NGKTVRAVVTSSNGCNTGPATSNVVTLDIDPCGAFSTSITGPNPISPGQQNAVYSVANQTGFTYTWSIEGGTIVSGQNTNAVTVDWDAATSNAFARTTASSCSISVLEKNSTNQTKTTTTTINTITTGTMQSQAKSGINVFPNPTTGSFNIEMPESGVDVFYEVLDVTGLSIARGTFTSTGDDQKIDIDFGPGMYQVILKYNNSITCIRLSKVQ